MTQTYKRIDHEEFGNCLEGITGNHDKYFGKTTPGVFVTERNQMYVLVEPSSPDFINYLHPELGQVELWNTHCTGELRWMERPSSPRDIGPDHLEALKHFGLIPKGMNEGEWLEVLAGLQVRKEDLSEAEIKMLEKAAAVKPPDTIATIIAEERVKGLDGEWHHTIRHSPEHSALWDLQHKGLLSLGGSSSGCGFGDEGHIWRSREYFSITSRGRKVLSEGCA